MQLLWQLSQKICSSVSSVSIVCRTLFSWPMWIVNAQIQNAVAWSFADTLLNSAIPMWLVSKKVATYFASIMSSSGLVVFSANMALHRKGAIMNADVASPDTLLIAVDDLMFEFDAFVLACLAAGVVLVRAVR
jgi:hypothetical protein